MGTLVHLLFLSLFDQGYEGSLLKVTSKNGKTSSPVGFVTFTTRIAADAAKQDLQGVRFDPDLPQTIRLEFARSNTKVSKPRLQSSPPIAQTHPALAVHPHLGALLQPGEGWPHPFSYAEILPPQFSPHFVHPMSHVALQAMHGPPVTTTDTSLWKSLSPNRSGLQ